MKNYFLNKMEEAEKETGGGDVSTSQEEVEKVEVAEETESDLITKIKNKQADPLEVVKSLEEQLLKHKKRDEESQKKAMAVQKSLDNHKKSEQKKAKKIEQEKLEKNGEYEKLLESFQRDKESLEKENESFKEKMEISNK